MADELDSKVAETVSHLDHHFDLPTVFCVVSPFLLDRRAYLKPKHKPCSELQDFVHEATLTSGPVQSVLRDGDTFTRFFHDGRFGPSAFGLPIHPRPAEDKP